MTELSKHEQAITDKIIYIRDTYGWTRWGDIQALAEKLQDENEKKAWLTACKKYAIYEKVHDQH